MDSTDSVSDAELEQLISQETGVDDEGVGVSDSETSMVIWLFLTFSGSKNWVHNENVRDREGRLQFELEKVMNITVVERQKS